jgi:lipopolysaccharide biosynthesis protein
LIQGNNTFILFNAWNNHLQNSYLEPNDEYGYSYLNYLSKAILNIEYEQIYNLKNLFYKSKIAVQAHLFYEDLIGDIINKTNNIQVKFDLYITIPSQSIYNKLEENIKYYKQIFI